MNLLPIQTTTQGGVTLTLESISDDFKFGDIEYKNEPLFFTKSIGETLGFADVNHSILNSHFERGYDYIVFDGDKLVQLRELLRSSQHALQISPMTRSLIMLTEPGLYGLLFKSEKPAAVKFRQWLAREVIPSIRKTGSYTVDSSLRNVVDQFKVAKELAEAVNYKGNFALLKADKVTKEITGVSPLRLLDTELRSENNEKLLTVTEISTRLGIGVRRVNPLLMALGYQYKDGKSWILTNKGKEKGVYLDVGKNRSSGTPIQQVKWMESIINLLNSEIEDDLSVLS